MSSSIYYCKISTNVYKANKISQNLYPQDLKTSKDILFYSKLIGLKFECINIIDFKLIRFMVTKTKNIRNKNLVG